MNSNKINLMLLSLLMFFSTAYSQEERIKDKTNEDKKEVQEEKKGKDKKPMKNTFENNVLLDQQTVIIPQAKSFEFLIQHRFGTISTDQYDLIGLLGSSNIRLGLNYSVTDWLQIGVGTMKYNYASDLNWKAAILRQTKGKGIPLSITYFGNAVVEAQKPENYGADFKKAYRFNYYQELMIARKFHKNFSAQIHVAYSHFNLVELVTTETDTVNNVGVEHNNFAVGLSGRIKFSPQTSVIFEYTQPLSFPEENKPQPNISLGVEIATSGHAFQIFIGSYRYILPQYNMAYNENKFWKGDILIGFNINRLWSF